MKEELKYKITDILREWKFANDDNLHAHDIAEKIADLIDQDQQETRIEDSYDSVFESFDKLDQALDEHFAVLDKIKDALSTTPKAEEVIHE